MIVTSVQIKTVKMQKHLYCPVFTKSSEIYGFQNFFCTFRRTLENFKKVVHNACITRT